MVEVEIPRADGLCAPDAVRQVGVVVVGREVDRALRVRGSHARHRRDPGHRPVHTTEGHRLERVAHLHDAARPGVDTRALQTTRSGNRMEQRQAATEQHRRDGDGEVVDQALGEELREDVQPSRAERCRVE